MTIASLGIDPGVTTGVALVSPTGTILWTYEVHASSIHAFGPGRVPWVDFVVTIEVTPVPTLSKLNRVLGDVVSSLRHAFPEALWVPPGVWKTSRAGVYPVPDGCSPHIRDAIRIAFYRYLRGV